MFFILMSNKSWVWTFHRFPPVSRRDVGSQHWTMGAAYLLPGWWQQHSARVLDHSSGGGGSVWAAHLKHTQWRKQMQPMWRCIFLGRPGWQHSALCNERSVLEHSSGGSASGGGSVWHQKARGLSWAKCLPTAQAWPNYLPWNLPAQQVHSSTMWYFCLPFLLFIWIWNEIYTNGHFRWEKYSIYTLTSGRSSWKSDTHRMVLWEKNLRHTNM